jgi:cobalt-precorrin 5A hydrolase
MKLAAVTFTLQGEALVRKLGEYFGIHHYSKNTYPDFNIKSLGEKLMKEYEGIIFIGATGIAVRTIAPYITTKDKDPAVVVIDNEGKFVISLLSGHLGGANELTLEISNILKAQPVITTATDTLGIEAPDVVAMKNNCKIESLSTAKDIAALLVKGEKVAFLDETNSSYIPKGYVGYKEGDISTIKALVCMTNKENSEDLSKLSRGIKVLRLIKKNIVLGVGCRKDYNSDKMLEFIKKSLKRYNINESAVNMIATVEVKAKESAILSLSEYYKCPLKIWTLEEIKKVQHKFKGSDFVEKTLGIRAVCEPSVDLCGARIMVEKIAYEGMTLCIGEGE